MEKRRVLIITYYWPPGGGIAVQRWVKFVKYLPSLGWEPVIYTVSNGDYPLIDKSLADEVSPDVHVIRRPIREPYRMYRWFRKKDKGGKLSIKLNKDAGLIDRISLWIRSNLFIPDARSLWIGPSVRFLSNYLRYARMNAIISTGPPHSLHVIGLKVAARTKLPWIADFRDPWTSMDYYHDLLLSRLADKRHRQLELKVLRSAASVVVIGRAMQREFEIKRGSKVEYLPNGFDGNEFAAIGKVSLDKHFTVVHAGSMFERRNPLALWKAIRELKDESSPVSKEIKVRLVGRIDESVTNSVDAMGLKDVVEEISFVPHHQLVRLLPAASLLLLAIDRFEGAQWVVTGKLFEYLAARRPVLGIGPTTGDAAEVVRETGAGTIFDFDDVSGIKQYLVEAFSKFKNNSLNIENSRIDQYSLQGLSQKLADILNQSQQ